MLFSPIGYRTVMFSTVDSQGSSASGNDTTSGEQGYDSVNSQPIVQNDSLTLNEDGVIELSLDPQEPSSILYNDSDPDGDPLSLIGLQAVNPDHQDWIIITEDANGVITSVTITPAPDYSGQFEFDYVVSDGNGGVSTARVDVLVDPVADQPTLMVTDTAAHSVSQTLIGDEGANVLTGGDASDLIVGLGGDDTLHATGADDLYEASLDIQAGLIDLDGSETLEITVSGLEEGMSLSAGTNNNDGTWSLEASELEGLKFLSSTYYTEHTLTITAHSIDTSTTGLHPAYDHALVSATLKVNFVDEILASGNAQNWVDAGVLLSARDLDGNTGTLTYNTNGVGVAGGDPVGTQINHQEGTGKSETLIAAFEVPASRVSVTVSNLVNSEHGGEQGKWEAFDVDGNLIGSATFGPEVITQQGHIGTFTLEGLGLISRVEFSALEYVDVVSGSDSSDYLIRSISYVPQALEGDTLLGGEGDDTIYGGFGNDELQGDAGNDFLDGGAGYDRAVYTGNQSDYQVRYDSLTESWTVSEVMKTPVVLDSESSGSSVTISDDGTRFNGSTNYTNSYVKSGMAFDANSTEGVYARVKVDVGSGKGANWNGVGLISEDAEFIATGSSFKNYNDAYIFMEEGFLYHGSTNTGLSAPIWGADDYVNIFVKNGSVWFGVNGQWLGDPEAGTSPAITGLTGQYSFLGGVYRNPDVNSAQIWDFGDATDMPESSQLLGESHYGTDILTNIEEIVFADGTFDLASAPKPVDGSIQVQNGDRAQWYLGTGEDEGFTYAIEGSVGDDGWIILETGRVRIIDANTGAYEFEAFDNGASEESFSYSISNTNGFSSSASVSVTVGSQSEYVGTQGNDVIFANSADDRVYGLDGDDLLKGQGGNDTLDGGSGYDWANYDGKQSDYQIRYDEGTESWTVSEVIQKPAVLDGESSGSSVTISDDGTRFNGSTNYTHSYVKSGMTFDANSTEGVYARVKVDVGSGKGANWNGVGLISEDAEFIATGSSFKNYNDAYIFMEEGFLYHGSTNTGLSAPIWGADDYVNIFVKNGSVWFGVNGQWLGDPEAGTSPAITGLTGQYSFLGAVYRNPDVNSAQIWDFGDATDMPESSQLLGESYSETDTLINIEKIAFADGSVDLASAPKPVDGSIQVQNGDRAQWHLGTGEDEGLTYAIEGSVGDDGWIALEAGRVRIVDANTGAYEFEAFDNGVRESSFTFFVTDEVGNTSYGDMNILVGFGAASLSDSGQQVDDLSYGNDIFTATENVDLLDGLAGDDLIKGEGGNDTLFGGSGDDALYGGSGDDVLEGGYGADSFNFVSEENASSALSNLEKVSSMGEDVLRDFTGGEDIIGLAASDFGFALGDLEEGNTYFETLDLGSFKEDGGAAIIVVGSQSGETEIWYTEDTANMDTSLETGNSYQIATVEGSGLNDISVSDFVVK